MMNNETETNWELIVKRLGDVFGEDIDLQAILFLIGVQELGKGYQEFSKSQKIDVMHIAICTLLESYDYYEYEGRDEDGWPHWKLNEQLPPLEAELQSQLIKQAIVNYFQKQENFPSSDLSETRKQPKKDS